MLPDLVLHTHQGVDNNLLDVRLDGVLPHISAIGLLEVVCQLLTVPHIAVTHSCVRLGSVFAHTIVCQMCVVVLDV